MKYRTFGKLDYKPSALGFGAMRLPTLEEGGIDEPEAIRMMRHAIDQGVNYVDTAWPYHKGESEVVVGKALKDGYREKVKLATKFPTWMMKQEADFDKYLDQQLEKLQTETIDFYLIHALSEDRWHEVYDLGILDLAEKALKDGRIQHLGFSFHDEYPVFKEIVDAYDWTFTMIIYNYMDANRQAGTRGLKYAADKGMAVVVMEPLRGGLLAGVNAPDAVMETWAKAENQRPPVEWALRWVWDKPEVSLLLSGMSTMAQVEQNLEIADSAGAPHNLTDAERELVSEVCDTYKDLSPIPCTDCKYCLPCPEDVSIPRIFSIYNEAMMYGDYERAKRQYENLPEEKRANICIECGQCEEQCPQHIVITQWLQTAHTYLTTGENA